MEFYFTSFNLGRMWAESVLYLFSANFALLERPQKSDQGEIYSEYQYEDKNHEKLLFYE